MYIQPNTYVISCFIYFQNSCRRIRTCRQENSLPPSLTRLRKPCGKRSPSPCTLSLGLLRLGSNGARYVRIFLINYSICRSMLVIFQTWQDIRSKVKARSSEIRRHQGATGGGPPSSQQLSLLDESVASMIGKTAIEGHGTAAESCTAFVSN